MSSEAGRERKVRKSVGEYARQWQSIALDVWVWELLFKFRELIGLHTALGSFSAFMSHRTHVAPSIMNVRQSDKQWLCGPIVSADGMKDFRCQFRLPVFGASLFLTTVPTCTHYTAPTGSVANDVTSPWQRTAMSSRYAPQWPWSIKCGRSIAY